MKVSLGENNNWRVGWEHAKDHSYTRCFITKVEEGNQYLTQFIGEAIVHPKDVQRYNKDTGRKVSLSRALKVGDFPAHQQQEFWKAYLEMRNGKW